MELLASFAGTLDLVLAEFAQGARELFLRFFAEFLGKAAWIWYAFILAVIALLAFDLGVVNRQDHEIGVAESLKMSAFYIGIGLAFLVGIIVGIVIQSENGPDCDDEG